MKGLAVIAFCVAFIAVVSARPDDEHYTDEYNDFDVDELLNSDNERLRKAYYNCLKTGEKCTKEGKILRDILPDALKTKCSKCDDVQKDKARKVIKYTIKNHPKEFLELETIFDPEHVYRTEYAEDIKKEGVTLPDLA